MYHLYSDTLFFTYLLCIFHFSLFHSTFLTVPLYFLWYFGSFVLVVTFILLVIMPLILLSPFCLLRFHCLVCQFVYLFVVTVVSSFSPLLSSPTLAVNPPTSSVPMSPLFMFLYFPLLSPSLSPSGHCQFVLYVQVSASVLLICSVD